MSKRKFLYTTIYVPGIHSLTRNAQCRYPAAGAEKKMDFDPPERPLPTS